VGRALIAIGISSAGSLVKLDGAITDAEELAAWARKNSYDPVTLFTDRGGAPVYARDILAACKKMLATEGLNNLVIFFSGHGYAIPGHEVWLLPKWEEDANEGVNVSASMLVAGRYKKPSISFIADACRVGWNVPSGIAGMVILPNSPQPSSEACVDEFFATRFGDPAQQWEEADRRTVFGIFSNELRNALSGEAAISRKDGRVVTSLSLADHLKKAVPRACVAKGARIQNPGTNAQWTEPTDVYAEFPLMLTLPKSPLLRKEEPDPSRDPILLEVDAAEKAAGLIIAHDAKRYRTAKGRVSFETQTGATIIGARVQDAVISSGKAEIYEGKPQHICVMAPGEQLYRRPEQPSTLLLRLIEHEKWAGCRIAIPIFPGFVATALVDGNGFSSLNYRPAGEELHDPYPLEEVAAEMAAMFRHGIMIERRRLDQVIAAFRDGKAENPALAVLAAHICFRIGDLEQIADMQRWPIGGGSYTPYDFLLLTGEKKPMRRRMLAGDLPIMSPAWGLLPAAGFGVDNLVREAAGGAMPSLWTMVNAEAGEKLAEYLKPDFSYEPSPETPRTLMSR
jgi:hypothetical protein